MKYLLLGGVFIIVMIVFYVYYKKEGFVIPNISLTNGMSSPTNLAVDTTGKVMLGTDKEVPVGTILPFGGNTEPSGYLLCDGRSVSSTIYADLYRVLGTRYGGDALNFNIPDMRARVPIGSGNTSYNLTNGVSMGSKVYALGERGGEEKHLLTVNEMPSHNHTGSTDSEGLHSHTINDPGHVHREWVTNGTKKCDCAPRDNNASAPPYKTDTERSWTGITINNAGLHSHNLTTNFVGGGQLFNVVQPYVAINYIIKF
jgi:microcystin-dependent protein